MKNKKIYDIEGVRLIPGDRVIYQPSGEEGRVLELGETETVLVDYDGQRHLTEARHLKITFGPKKSNYAKHSAALNG